MGKPDEVRSVSLPGDMVITGNYFFIFFIFFFLGGGEEEHREGQYGWRRESFDGRH